MLISYVFQKLFRCKLFSFCQKGLPVENINMFLSLDVINVYFIKNWNQTKLTCTYTKTRLNIRNSLWWLAPFTTAAKHIRKSEKAVL